MSNAEVSSSQMNELLNKSGLLRIPLHLGRVLSQHEPAIVDAYPSPASKKIDQDGIPFAFRYPGQRPETSFVVIKGSVDACSVSTEDNPSFYINTTSVLESEAVFNLDDILQSLEAAPMAERYPIIAFGSNANPGQLAQKFKDLEGADQNIVPTMVAKIKRVVPVYAARIGINGYIFTDLFPAGDDVESRVHVNFLSRPQLGAMDATEKAYSLCEVPNLELETHDGLGYRMSAYLYVGREDSLGANILVDDQSRPIRLAEISTSGGNLDELFAVMTQTEAQRYIFDVAGHKIADALKLHVTPKDEVDLIKLIINRKDEPRLASFRSYVKENEGGQPLGRMVGRYIQQAMSDTGRTIQASGLRKIIPKEAQDINLEQALTFSELKDK
jgi:hypothetical protein